MADLRKPDTSEPSGVAARSRNSDTDILTLERQIVALQREIDKPEADLSDDAMSPLIDQQNELDLKIIALPANTAREVDAKLRRIVAWLRQDRGGFFQQLADAMYGAETGSEAPEGGPCAEPIFAAAAAYIEAIDAAEALSSEMDEAERDKIWEGVFGKADVARGITPTTVTGMVCKIEFYQRQFGPDDVQPDYVMEDLADCLKSLAEPTGEGALYTDAIRQDVFELDGPICGVEDYCTTLTTLIDQISDRELKHVMGEVVADLGSDVLKLKKLFGQLFEAVIENVRLPSPVNDGSAKGGAS